MSLPKDVFSVDNKNWETAIFHVILFVAKRVSNGDESSLARVMLLRSNAIGVLVEFLSSKVEVSN